MNVRKETKLIKAQNLSQLVSAVGCFQWRNEIANLTSGIRH